MVDVAGRCQFRLRSLVLVVTAYCIWLAIQVGYVGRREVATGEVWGWVLVCLVWSLLAGVVGWMAGRQGLSPVIWFIVALVLNPLMAWLGIVFANEVGSAVFAERR